MDSRSVPLNILIPQESDDAKLSPGNRLFQPESDILDVLGAQFVSAFEDTDTQLIKRKIQNAFLESDDKVNHLELNKMFPDLEVPFNKPTSLELAKSINKQNMKRRQLAKVIANGDPEGLMQRASGLLLGVGAGLMDPVGMALGMGIGRGITTLMGKVLLRSGGTLARVIRPITKGLGGRVFEGAVGNTIQELSIGRPLLKQEQVDISVYDTLTQAIGAGIAFPLLARGSRNIFKFISRGNDATLKATKTYGLAESQFENGKRLNTEPYVNAEMKKELPKMKEDLKTVKEELLAAEGGKPRPKKLSSQAVRRAELDSLVEPLSEFETAALDRKVKSITSGTKITEVSPTEQARKIVQEIRSLSRGVDGGPPRFTKAQADIFSERVFKAADEITSKKRKAFFEGVETIEDFLGKIAPEQVDVDLRVKAEVVELKKSVKELEELVDMAEKAEAPNRAAEAKKANDITEDLYYDKEVMDGFNDRADTLIPVDRKIEFEERTAVFEEEFTNFEDQGDLSPAVKKAFDEARVELSQIETLDQIAKEATFCLR